MHLIALACDLDGTLADSGEVAADTWALLRQAKTAGLALLLVTGRILQSFTPDGPYAEIFDAIVAEDGAVVYCDAAVWTSQHQFNRAPGSAVDPTGARDGDRRHTRAA
jgi:hydroxymethylpyrimidine pyrophosphatase-like HAD family hydrolase